MDNEIPQSAADAVSAATGAAPETAESMADAASTVTRAVTDVALTAADAVSSATGVAADTVTAATDAAGTGFALVPDKLYYFIMVPMVYIAISAMIVGIAIRMIALLRAPAPAYTLRTFPEKRRPFPAALSDTFTMPSVRKHRPVFWVFLMIYHIGFLLLILGHLDLFPAIHIVPPESRHMLGAGSVGLAVTVPLLYFLIRRFKGEVRRISVPSDYLLLMLLLFIFLLGDLISWGNSWTKNGFVMTKNDFGNYFGILSGFTFADPRTVLHGSHYHFIVLHVLLAELFMVLLPFTKVAHAFFSLPVNLLRRK